jgi:methylated-DNA-[protein]-cysteine S-methyltransferase
MSDLYTTFPSPVGELTLVGDERALRALYFPGRAPRHDGLIRTAGPFAAAVEQLEEYFEGARMEFDLALEPRGRPFDRAVWALLAEIPYGETRSYGELARALGRPDRARAVGSANARNPIPIVLPCHRVIGSDGSLTGYGGGLDLKRALLALEQGAWQQSLPLA